MILLLLTLLAKDFTTIDGQAIDPFMQGKFPLFFFITHDCPISNQFAREMRRICEDYRDQGVACALVHVDHTLDAAAARKHAQDYAHGDYPKFIDRQHALVRRAGATVTPEAALFDRAGKLLYRGRIDDSFLILGQSRRVPRSPDLRNAIIAAVAGKPITVPRTRAVGCAITEPTLLR
jgi:hypothetical protein